MLRGLMVGVILLGGVVMVLFNMEKISKNMHKILASLNLQAIVTNVWYGMVAATSFLACLTLHVLIKTISYDEAGPIMTVLFNVGLVTAMSLNLKDVGWKSKNTHVDEIILCVTAGYYVYQMFGLRLKESIQDRYKGLGALAAMSFVSNTLCRQEGASVHLLFLFLFSSPIPILQLPGFGSAKFVDSLAYKCSVWAAYFWAGYHRVAVGLGLAYKLWTVSEFQFEKYELPLFVTMYCAAISGVFYCIEVIRKREEQKMLMAGKEKFYIEKWSSVQSSPHSKTDVTRDGTCGVKVEKCENVGVLKRKVVGAYE